MTKNPLTDTQLVILSAAAQRDDMRIELPERLRGGAAKAVLATLLGKALIVVEPDQASEGDHLDGVDQTQYCISREGLAAIGVEADADQDEAQPGADGATPGVGSDETDQPEVPGANAAPSTSPRAGTKLADVIALLERPEGASIDELAAATGWLAHTTRAALTGLRKRGILIERAKRDHGTTVYRIAPATLAEPIVEAA